MDSSMFPLCHLSEIIMQCCNFDLTFLRKDDALIYMCTEFEVTTFLSSRPLSQKGKDRQTTDGQLLSEMRPYWQPHNNRSNNSNDTTTGEPQNSAVIDILRRFNVSDSLRTSSAIVVQHNANTHIRVYARWHGCSTFQLESALHRIRLLARPWLNLNPGRQVKVDVRADELK